MTAWDAGFAGTLHRHQVDALAGIEAAWAAGADRALVVLPPGAGKTVVGLEAVRRLGRPALVLSPNTAIQGQWVRQWTAFDGATGFPIGTDRSMDTPITSLTYQALATFDAEAEVDEDGDEVSSPGPHLDRLTADARALVDRLERLGDVTLVLDECHHLLEVWGELLGEVLQRLPRARVVALTATPATALAADEAALVDRLLGPPVYSLGIPAVVRDGRLAPYAELAWLCEPTAGERQWLAAEAERFAELRTDLTDPAFAATAFLPWLDARVGRVGAGEWARLEKDRPDLAGALLRFHHAGLVAAPLGARVREEHRHDPRADDWAVVIGAYVGEALRPSADPRDGAALQRLRAALPSVGFSLTGAGVRRGRSPVDRVLARSEAKTRAAVDIVAAERGSLLEHLRALVLCDHESATATLPARLTGVLEPDAGSARSALQHLVADPALAGLGIAMVTGRTVAADERAAAAVVDSARAAGLALSARATGGGVVELDGAWRSRQWVPVVTDLFEKGVIGVLVGTRGLLGEGWDARSVTTLVDLTSATTPTAVVQTRGRALRLDPARPDKVAHTWSVVCVDHTHPRGWQDYARFVRKHDGYLGIDDAGEVVAGVAHVSAALSPYEPPPTDALDAFNAAMLVRAEDRDRTRALWRVGEPYADVLVPTVRVRPTRASPAATDGGAPPVPPARLPSTTGVVAAAGRAARNPATPRPAAVVGAVAAAAVLATVLGVAAAPVWAWLALALPALVVGVAVRRAGADAVSAYADVVGEPGVATYAAVVADALHEAGRCPQAAADVRVRVDADGLTGFDLPGPAAALFATALEEVLAAPVQPRYVIGRPRLPGLPASPRAARQQARAAFRGRLDLPVVVHAVPTVFGVNAAAAAAFGRAWRRWVAATDPLYTGSAEGAGLLASAGGESPVPVETAVRTRWQ